MNLELATPIGATSRDMRRLIFCRGRLHLTAFHAGILVVAILGAVTASLTLPAAGETSHAGAVTPPTQGPTSGSPTTSR
jgi:hypothetical protein